MMKINTVLKHPPPSFFAPYPAATPRRSLLIEIHLQSVRRSGVQGPYPTPANKEPSSHA
jgi:hypothetical protein